MTNRENDESQDKKEINIKSAPGAIIGDNAHPTQYFGSIHYHATPDSEPKITYWTGRPATIKELFIGRSEDIDRLISVFSGRQAIVISGFAGTGNKTRLAAEYSFRIGLNGFWTTAGTSVAQTISALAPALDIHPQGKSDDNITEEVQSRLASLPEDTLWVMDNLPDIEQINQLVNLTGNVRIVVTTRDSRKHLLSPAVAFLGLEVLNEEAAIELLCSRSNTDRKHPLLLSVVERVGCLPVALEQIAVWLGEPMRTPEKVMEQLEKAPNPLQLKVFQEAAGAASIPRVEGVFFTLTGTLESLPEDIRQSLDYLGYIADAPVSEKLAMALTGLSDDGLSELITECMGQSILSWTWADNNPLITGGRNSDC